MSKLKWLTNTIAEQFVGYWFLTYGGVLVALAASIFLAMFAIDGGYPWVVTIIFSALAFWAIANGAFKINALLLKRKSQEPLTVPPAPPTQQMTQSGVSVSNNPIFAPQITIGQLDNQSKSQQSEAPKVEPKLPNFVCKKPDYIISHQDLMSGLLFEGRQTHQYMFDSDTVAVVAEISNEFSPSLDVGDVDDITAQIFYKPLDGQSIQMNRGAWLSNANRVRFKVNDTKKLIIAGVRERDPYTFAFTREYRSDIKTLESLTTPLKADYYHVEVRLISESRSILYKTFNFNLTTTREPKNYWTELTLIEELTPKEIRHRLEIFLNEGGEILKNFPRDKEKTAADVENVDEWEKKVAKFLSQYPEQLSTALFLSNYPEAYLTGTAQGSNWPSLKRMATRLARLKELIDELRKG